MGVLDAFCELLSSHLWPILPNTPIGPLFMGANDARVGLMVMHGSDLSKRRMEGIGTKKLSHHMTSPSRGASRFSTSWQPGLPQIGRRSMTSAPRPIQGALPSITGELGLVGG